MLRRYYTLRCYCLLRALFIDAAYAPYDALIRRFFFFTMPDAYLMTITNIATGCLLALCRFATPTPRYAATRFQRLHFFLICYALMPYTLCCAILLRFAVFSIRMRCVCARARRHDCRLSVVDMLRFFDAAAADAATLASRVKRTEEMLRRHVFAMLRCRPYWYYYAAAIFS